MKNGDLKYSLFQTNWSWFGLCWNRKGLVRTSLPVADRVTAKKALLRAIDSAELGHAGKIKKDIIAYYEGVCVDFSDMAVSLESFTDFEKQVLSALRTAAYGQRLTYRQLAEMAGSPRASRAIGQVMAKNPLPLIIPCHRVLRTDGSLGGFSAPGGVKTKKRMLDLEISGKST